MNVFHFEGTDKEIILDIGEVKKKTVGELFRSGGRLITVCDDEYGNVYQIRVEKAVIQGRNQYSGMCFLDHKPSYQADFRGDRTLLEVINAIAGGTIINERGCVQNG